MHWAPHKYTLIIWVSVYISLGMNVIHREKVHNNFAAHTDAIENTCYAFCNRNQFHFDDDIFVQLHFKTIKFMINQLIKYHLNVCTCIEWIMCVRMPRQMDTWWTAQPSEEQCVMCLCVWVEQILQIHFRWMPVFVLCIAVEMKHVRKYIRSYSLYLRIECIRLTFLFMIMLNCKCVYNKAPAIIYAKKFHLNSSS